MPLGAIGGLIGKGLSWLGGGSAAAKGLGTAASALSGFITPGGQGPGSQAYRSLQGAFKAADEAGLHRLAVAGSPAGYSPVPSQAAEGLLNASQMIGQGRSKKEEELIDAQIAESRSRTLINQANARRALMGPQPGLGSTGGSAFDRLANGLDRAISREPERDMPATQTVTLGDRTARGPNPEAFEVGMSELIAGGLIYGSQWLATELGRRIRQMEQQDDRKRGGSRRRQGDYFFTDRPVGTGSRTKGRK